MTTRDLNWLQLVQKAHGKEWNEKDTAYEFTGRTFKDTGAALTAIEVIDVLSSSLYADNYADNYA